MKIGIAVMITFVFAVRSSCATSLDGVRDINLNAEILIKAYNENEVEANAKYGGHRVTVGGIVGKVGVDQDGDPYVELVPSIATDATAGHHVHCKFSERLNAQVARLRKGSLLGIHGIVVGVRAGTVVIKDCSL